jgi:hypothetical protein
MPGTRAAAGTAVLQQIESSRYNNAVTFRRELQSSSYSTEKDSLMRFSPWLVCGLLVGSLAFSGGCNRQQDVVPYEEAEQAPPEEHHHHHHHGHGPHGGHLIDLGDHEYLAEIVFDEQTKAITVYLFDHDSGEFLPIEQEEITLTLRIDGEPRSFTLPAVRRDEDPEGRSSRFELAGDETIAEHIGDEEDLEGEIHATIDGRDLTGRITHDHDHGHDH